MLADEDALAQPLALVDAAFRAACDDPARLASGHGWGVRATIEAAVARAGGLARVPALDATPVETLRPGSLVRFQGMVQDTWDPEYYLGVYELRDLATGAITLKTGKFSDAVDAPPGSEVLPPPRGPPAERDGCRGRIYQRTPVFVVPTPGLSGWAAAARKAQCAGAAPGPAAHPARAKRAAPDDAGAGAGGRGVDADAGGMDVDDAAHDAFATKRTGARGVRGAAVDASLHPAVAAGFRYAGAANGNAAVGAGATAPAAGAAATGGRRTAVVVKLYDEEETGGVPHVSELVEFVGILSLERDTPEPETIAAGAPRGGAGVGGGDADGGWVDNDDERAHRPPSSAVPRLHCVSWARVGGRPNPLLPPAADAAARAAATAAARAAAPALRAAARGAFAAALGGDELAAEYVLLWALSAVTARVGPAGAQTAVGALPLSLVAPPPRAQRPAAPPAPLPSPPAISRALAALAPVTRHLPVTIGALNAGAYRPVRDVASALLSDAALQLPAGALLVADERTMGAGELSTAGVANLRALAALASRQTLEYGFGPYELAFETDVPTLFLSQGKPLAASAATTLADAGPGGAEACEVPVDAASIGGDDGARAPDAATAATAAAAAAAAAAAEVDAAMEAVVSRAPGGADAVRAYLTLAAEAPAALGEAIARTAQDAFVAARQADATVGAPTLHRWCTLARLRAQSELAAEVTTEHWSATLALEAERAARVRARASAVPARAGGGGGVLV
ncbi:hypothetical protein KFE25_004395 [Diacronema lutheri]|uniref:Mini-chromosome maintenance complex-binding protein n=1 Tax=Diacronema lutheri TaxID=2081491 RepID=A0A8J6C6Y1_DIALT|nr:hypothetical protein KFE25_004395 [Diacronema lutheri]